MKYGRIVGYTLLVYFVVLSAAFEVNAQTREIYKLDNIGFVTEFKGESINCSHLSVDRYTDLRLDDKHAELTVIKRKGHDDIQKQRVAGLKIILRATPQLEQFPQAKEAFLKAAETWEALIASPISIIIDVDFGPTRFGVPFPKGVLGATRPQILGGDNLYGYIRSALTQRRDFNDRQREIFNLLPAKQVPTDSGVTDSMLGTAANFRALGLLAPNANPDSEAYYGELPSVGFSSEFPFDFDPSDGIDSGKIDFNSVAVHEIGHVLGFLSMAGIRELLPSTPNYLAIWDMFRFNRGISLDRFSQERRRLLSGGDAVHFAGLHELALATGVNEGADGTQSSHWKDDFFTGQYVGIMDPTLTLGRKDEITHNDLTTLEDLGYKIRTQSSVAETLSVDDNSPDETLPQAPDTLYVTRYTPSKYPAKIDLFRIAISVNKDHPLNTSIPIRIVVFSDTDGKGEAPPDNPYFLYDQTFILPAIESSRFIEFTIDGPVITSGDIFIGIQSSLDMYLDTTPSDIGWRSYSKIIRDNEGGGFKPLKWNESMPANLFLRLGIINPIEAVPYPEIRTASPDIISAGSRDFLISVSGRNFISDSKILWNGSEMVTRYRNGSELETTIPASQAANIGKAEISVLNAGSLLSKIYEIDINSQNPVPVAKRLDWDEIPTTGAPANITVYGKNFVPGSKVKIDNEARPTYFINSTRLLVSVFGKDYAEPATKIITVMNPEPGGGGSSELKLKVFNCEYKLSHTKNDYPARSPRVGSKYPKYIYDGVLLSTSEVCRWSVSTDASWIKITNPDVGKGQGRYVIDFKIDRNYYWNERIGTINVEGQTLEIIQAGM